ncbi:unnamed protein product [Polarella glacialis]|uniref:Uncharacterized protein n=1 Tax=Polarella glacialis TaxID=89957 RepID=A0A813IF84_POLGL|nr:unnamed protein product [Polarella glacialis]
MRLPQAKNKYPASVQVTVDDITGASRGRGPRLQGGGSNGDIESEEDVLSLAGALENFRRARALEALGPETSVSSRLRQRSPPQRLALKKARVGPSSELLRSGPRAVLRFKLKPRSEWAQRRLCCIALCKEEPQSCPMARLPQGFLREFVEAVFSFL